MNEGYTVTHYSLQVLYYLGCQTVYIVGMDHSFAQTGRPNEQQLMQGADPNHFDKSYQQPSLLLRQPWPLYLCTQYPAVFTVSNLFISRYFANKKWDLADVKNNERYYKFSRQQYERDGRRIVDVTVGGKCHVFEKGDYLQHLYE